MIRYLLALGMVFILSGILFLMTITRIDPFGPQKNLGILLFFISLFLMMASLWTLILFFGKELFARRTLGIKSLYTALRRGVFIGVFITALILFAFLNMLDIYAAFLTALFLSLVEYSISMYQLPKIETKPDNES